MKVKRRTEVARNSKLDGGYGWFVCCGTFIVNFVVFGIHNSFGVVYVSLLDDLNLGAVQTGKFNDTLRVRYLATTICLEKKNPVTCEYLSCSLRPDSDAVLFMSRT